MEQARESSDEWSRDQPPVGGHRGRGQARDGVNLVRLVSLVGWVCSSGAQKEGKNSTTVWSVYSFDAPSSTALKSWLVVARGASRPLRLVGHLGWVHRQEARAVGRPRERMMPLREALTPRRDRAGLARKTRRPAGCASELLGPGCEVTDCTPSAPSAQQLAASKQCSGTFGNRVLYTEFYDKALSHNTWHGTGALCIHCITEAGTLVGI